MNKSHLINFNINTDDRGSLIAIEGNNTLNFNIKRIFYIFDLNTQSTRGEHANKISTMCFFTLKGSCKILVDNGTEKETFILDNPIKGLLCEPMTWKKIYDFSSDCILMSLCDTNYDSNEYINDYNDFLKEINK